MESKDAFTLFARKHHCRKCGGAFLAKCMVKKPVRNRRGLVAALPADLSGLCGVASRRVAQQWQQHTGEEVLAVLDECV